VSEEKIDIGKLPWRRSSDFREKFSDVMRVGVVGERGVFLEFGHLDNDGYGEDGRPMDPHISWHTRIIISFEHLKAISQVLTDIVKREEAKKEG